ncbi:unnamed protein product, partial [Phaeothamnion confervicola]
PSCNKSRPAKTDISKSFHMKDFEFRTHGHQPTRNVGTTHDPSAKAATASVI